MKVLLIIDVQNDFCKGGSLEVPGGDEIISTINTLIARNEFDLIVASKDWHPENHSSFKSTWPKHCIQNTDGAAFHEHLDTKNIDYIVEKGTAVEIDSYSAFFDNDHKKETSLRKILEDVYEKTYGKSTTKPLEIVVAGLALDYCVAYTAKDAASLGYKTSIVLDGTRAVEQDQQKIISLLRDLNQAGIEIVCAKEILPEREVPLQINREIHP